MVLRLPPLARTPRALTGLMLGLLAACGDLPTVPSDVPAASPRSALHASVDAGSGTALVDGNSGRCLDVLGESREAGTPLIIYDCHGRDNQRFTYPALGETGEVRVYAGTSTPLCLDAESAGLHDGTRVIAWPCHGGANQQWERTAHGELRGMQSGLCIDVLGARTGNLTTVWLWTCHGGANQRWDAAGAPPPAAAHTLYALQSFPQGEGSPARPELIVFRSDRPSEIVRRVEFVRPAGAPREVIESWDQRPADGLLYGIDAYSRVFTLDPATGAVVQSGGPDPFTPSLSIAGAAYQGVGVAFEPGGALHVVSASGTEHLRVDPDLGTATALPPLVYADGDPNAGRSPAVSGIAYAPSVGGAPPVLYAIDAAQEVLVRIPDPDRGELVTIGSLGLPSDSDAQARFTRESDFDIADDGTAYVTFNRYEITLGTRSTSLYRVDLATGAATLLGPIGDGRVSIFGMAVARD